MVKKQKWLFFIPMQILTSIKNIFSVFFLQKAYNSSRDKSQVSQDGNPFLTQDNIAIH